MNSTDIVRARGVRKYKAQLGSLNRLVSRYLEDGLGMADPKISAAVELRNQVLKSGRCVKPAQIRELIYS